MLGDERGAISARAFDIHGGGIDLTELHPALQLELKGPWPPYSFATLDSHDRPAECSPEPRSRPEATTQISPVDLLDRLLGTGVVLAGDVVISFAGVDLVQVQLHR